MRKIELLKPCLLYCLLFLMAACNSDSIVGSVSDLPCEDTNCADYASRTEAQQNFDWDPDCRGDLDADNDGLACEENQWTDYYSSIGGGGTEG